MKKIFLAVAMIALISGTASAQSLKDLLKGISKESSLKDVVESVVGTSLNESIVGTWTYKGSAVKLKSDNTLTELAGNAAVTTVTDKLDGYLSKVGIKPGSFQFTFQSDSTFTTKVLKKTVSGTYSIGEDDGSINLKFGKQMQWLSMTGEADVTSSSATLVFEADKFLDLIEKLAAVAGKSNSTIATIATLLSNYDGMMIGFEMSK